MLGKQSIRFDNPPYIVNSASIVGSKEGQGPMGKLFDKVGQDDMFGAQTWEEAESALLKDALQMALSKENLKKEDIQLIFAGDLLGQSIASSFGLASFHTPHVGLYGACSTCGLSIAVGSMAIAGGFVEKAACVTSSHFASAEKEFRFPLAYGNQRPMSSTWTV
ncbi:MAG: stage V sporulation protein AD, partial [Lachnospiraceae bacterium]|nr:stage V sporulation protein AD [Lachnospiraceae bacterium]